MSEARSVKEYYIEPPMRLVETDWQLREGGVVFEINTKIWVDQHVPEYRVVIPENFREKAETLEHWDSRYPAEMRFITYVPTGRAVYDTSKPHKEAIVWEYILESLLGKKDLKHR